jgi:GTP-binding protein
MSSPDDLPNSYKRFLLGSIVKTHDLQGVPIRIMFRKGNNPYIKK